MQREIFNSQDQLCAKGTGTFALFTAEAIVRLGIMDQTTVNDFLSFTQK